MGERTNSPRSCQELKIQRPASLGLPFIEGPPDLVQPRILPRERTERILDLSGRIVWASILPARRLLSYSSETSAPVRQLNQRFCGAIKPRQCTGIQPACQCRHSRPGLLGAQTIHPIQQPVVEVAQTPTPCRFAAVPLGKRDNKPAFSTSTLSRLPRGDSREAAGGSGSEPLLPRAARGVRIRGNLPPLRSRSLTPSHGLAPVATLWRRYEGVNESKLRMKPEN